MFFYIVCMTLSLNAENDNQVLYIQKIFHDNLDDFLNDGVNSTIIFSKLLY